MPLLRSFDHVSNQATNISRLWRFRRFSGFVFEKLILDHGQLAPKVLFHRHSDLVLFKLDRLFFRIAVELDPLLAIYTFELFVYLIAPANQLLAAWLWLGHLRTSNIHLG